MSNTGLSSLNFMDGLMKGATFVNGFQQQKRANDIEDKKLTMAEATHNQQTKLNDLSIQGKETEALLKDFDRDTRLLAESGKAPDDAFYQKYKSVLRPVMNEENRRRQIEAYQGLAQAVNNDDYGPNFHKYMNMALKDKFDKSEEVDGLKREFLAAKTVPTGYDDDGDNEQDTYAVPVLQVTRPDGTKYLAPFTKNGTADPDDDVVLFNDDLMGEFLENMRQRAELATDIHQFSDDPLKQIAALRRGVLGSEAGDGYELKEAYDDQSGTKRLAAINKKTGQLSHWIGGASANDGKGGSGGKGGKKGDFDVDGYLQMQQEIRTSTNFATPEDRAAAAAEVDRDIAIKWGVPPQFVLKTHQAKRLRGDYSPLTHADVAEVMAASEARERVETDIESTMAENPEVFGRPGLAQVNQVNNVPGNPPPASPPPSPQLSQAQSDVIDTAVAELERIQRVVNDPKATNSERSDARKLRTQILRDMTKKERGMLDAEISRRRNMEKERSAQEQTAAEIDGLQQRLSDPEGYRTDIERAIAQRKLIELLEKRTGKSTPAAGL